MTRVPYAGDEKASLTASLDRHRDAVLSSTIIVLVSEWQYRRGLRD
jgi:hypothetical protein